MQSIRDFASAIGVAARFPQSRRFVAALLERRRIRLLMWWWASFAVLIAYALLREKMDNVGLPRHGAELDEQMFGTLPSLWLQSRILHHSPELLEWCSVIIHSSWFFVPPLAGILVSFQRPERLGSFFRWWLALQLVALPLFALFPTRPPWMESADVTRIIALRYGGTITDANPLAAMPSLHVAFPLLISLWFFRERWKWPALTMLGYSFLVAFEVVFSGEHYVADVMGAVGVSVSIAVAATLDYRAMLNWNHSRARKARAAGIEAPAVASRAQLPRRARAQVLLESVVLAPITFVGQVNRPDASTSPGDSRRN